MGIFHSKENTGKNGLLHLVVEGEVELSQLFADETDSKYWHFLDHKVIIAHVSRNLFCDARPLLAWNLNAADRGDYLNKEKNTLAAALRIDFSLSIMVPRTMSLKEAFELWLSACHKYLSLACVEEFVPWIW